METYSKINNKYNTQLSNVSVIEKHLKPKLGTYRFSTLSPATIQEFINDKFLDSLAKSTIESIIAPLSQAFEYAIDLGYVKENPCRRIKYPKNCRPPKQREIISINEYNMIVETMKNHKPFDIAIMIGWYAGLRISETFALTWDDINFNQKTITINKQIIKRNFGTDIPKAYNEKKIKKEHSVWYFQSPKTLTSNRIIDVSDDLIKVLIEWKNEQLKNKNIYGAYNVNREHQKNPRTLEFSGILNIYQRELTQNNKKCIEIKLPTRMIEKKRSK